MAAAAPRPIFKKKLSRGRGRSPMFWPFITDLNATNIFTNKNVIVIIRSGSQDKQSNQVPRVFNELMCSAVQCSAVQCNAVPCMLVYQKQEVTDGNTVQGLPLAKRQDNEDELRCILCNTLSISVMVCQVPYLAYGSAQLA